MGSAFLYLGIVLMWLCVLVPMWLRRDRHTVDIADLYEEHEQPGEFGGDTLADLPVPEVPGATGRATGDHATDTADDDVTVEYTSSARMAEPRKASSTGTSTPGGSTGTSIPGGSTGTSSAGRGAKPVTSPPVTTPPDTRPGVNGWPGGEPGTPSEAALAHAESRHRSQVLARRRRWLICSLLLSVASMVTAAVGVAPWWSAAPSLGFLVSYLIMLRIAVTTDRERRAAEAKARAERQRKALEHKRAQEAAAAAQPAEAEIIEFVKPAEPFDQHADRSRRAVGD